MSIDQILDNAFTPISNAVSSVIFYAEPVSGFDIKLILVWLVALSLFLTLYLGFINIRFFKHAIDVLRGKYDDPNADGEINRFKALTTSLSGTVGLGNIAGVAVAVSLGGPGAVFWMAVMGVFGMSAKFAEAALGVKYRHHRDPNNPASISGGPMYYIMAAFEKIKKPKIGKAFASLFALCVIGGAIGAGNMFQSNQAFQQLLTVTGGAEASVLADKGWVFGLIVAVLVGVVIIGGLKSIANVASRVVPAMGAIYLIAGLVVIGMHIDNLGWAFATIFQQAFSPEAGIGGVIGGLLVGVQRAVFSNEAGVGSAAIVHSTAKTDQPISQGFVGMLGPFIDTLIICMVTALVIVITRSYESYEQFSYISDSTVRGVALTSHAFGMALPWFPYVLTVVVLLFAFSTMISWSYYGLKGISYLVGENKKIALAYKITFCAFTVLGASASLGSVINFSDSVIFAMAIPNAIGLYILAPELKADLKEYLQRLKNK